MDEARWARELRLVQMGGAICSLYRHGDRRAEHNVFVDRAALLTVPRSDVPARFVMNHTTQRDQIEVAPTSLRWCRRCVAATALTWPWLLASGHPAIPRHQPRPSSYSTATRLLPAFEAGHGGVSTRRWPSQARLDHDAQGLRSVHVVSPGR